MSLRRLNEILRVKPEPETTPTLARLIERDKARETVANYLITPALRAQFTRIFECLVHDKGQGFWVQAEFGAGKTHFLGTIVDLLIWREESVWEALRDPELVAEYGGALGKKKYFPVAFSLRGMGDTAGNDSLMRAFEDQIRESLEHFAPDIALQVKLTSADLAAAWWAEQASEHERAAVRSFFQKEHKESPEDFQTKCGVRQFGQEIQASGLAEGRLRSRFKERFAFIYDQITRLGHYDGIIVVVDEYRFWQDRHVPGTAAYAEDEEILETLAHVLPSEQRNIVSVVSSQGDVPQKLSGGGQGDRFVQIQLLADRNKSDFGEIVAFRTRELLEGAEVDIKDYYDHCRKEYRFIRQANISQERFAAIFPFQPRTFDVVRNITQSAERHNLPTARSAIRMAWQVLRDDDFLRKTRLVVLPDLMATDELQRGLTSEFYRDGYQALCTAGDELVNLDVAPEEREQAKRLLETLYLSAVSLPENLRDGLTKREVAEAAWLEDEAIGPADQAEELLKKMQAAGFPVRIDQKTRDGETVAVYSYELSSTTVSPAKYFAPLKRRFKEQREAQDSKWLESLFWDVNDITEEAQRELGIDGGILADFRPTDTRTVKERDERRPPAYEFPHRAATSTRCLRVGYSGEVVVSRIWLMEFGEEIRNPDQHFRLVYLTGHPDKDEQRIARELGEDRIAVCWPEVLSPDTREALADLLAADQMLRDYTGASQEPLRDYAKARRRDAIKAILKAQLDEFRRGRVITKQQYGIKSVEVFRRSKGREQDLGQKLLEKAYTAPLFNDRGFQKDLNETDARKIYRGLFQKDAGKAERDAVQNFAVGLELVSKSQPSTLDAAGSAAIARIEELRRDRSEVRLSELKSALCRPPFGLTDWMVALYVFAMVRQGTIDLLVGSGLMLLNGRPLAGDRLTAGTLPQLDWNARMDKALLGARLVPAVRKGWDQVLPWARVLDASFKPAMTPEEEQARNEELQERLRRLKADVPDVEQGVVGLASLLGSKLPADVVAVLATLKGLAETSTYQEFDAAVREAYPDPSAFAAAYDKYQRARRLYGLAFDVSERVRYLDKACAVDTVELDRSLLRAQIAFDSLLANPSLAESQKESFDRWKANYVQAYRKGHRRHNEAVASLRERLEGLRSRAKALARMNSISELGPATAAALRVPSALASVETSLQTCPETMKAAVDGADPICAKCGWTPQRDIPEREVARLQATIEDTLAERFQRFKDAAIEQVLRKAGEQGIAELLEVIQLADADRLATCLTPAVVDLVRKILYDDTVVNEQVPIAPMLRKLGGIDSSCMDEALSTLGDLVRQEIRAAEKRHGPGKRVRVFLTVDPVDPPQEQETVDPGRRQK